MSIFNSNTTYVISQDITLTADETICNNPQLFYVINLTDVVCRTSGSQSGSNWQSGDVLVKTGTTPSIEVIG